MNKPNITPGTLIFPRTRRWVPLGDGTFEPVPSPMLLVVATSPVCIALVSGAVPTLRRDVRVDADDLVIPPVLT